MLSHFAVNMRARMKPKKFLALAAQPAPLGKRIKRETANKCVVFISGLLFVEYAVFRPPQINAAETIAAACAVKQKIAIAAVLTAD